MIGKKRANDEKKSKSETFLSKLYDILYENKNKEIIDWDIEGKKIIIKDIINFCNIVLPKYYKHQNYSSFVRQLNLYGFHKNKGVIKNGEEYENEKFKKNITKDEIAKIPRLTKKMKRLIEYIAKNKKEKFKKKKSSRISINENNELIFLYEKNKENLKNSNLIKKRMEELKKENNTLIGEIEIIKAKLIIHETIIERIIKNQNFNNSIIKEKVIEQEQHNIDNINDINNRIINLNKNINNEQNFTNEISVINSENDFPFLNFIFPPNFASNDA